MADGGGGPSIQAAGQSCRVAYIEYPSGATNVPPPQGCGSCKCSDGQLDCEEQPCPLGAPVLPCNGKIDSDTISKDRAYVAGHTLTLDVSHPGGCGRHDYAVCYTDVSEGDGSFVELHVIHDGHGDTCEDSIQVSLSFDLRPLADDYVAQRGPGAVIATGYGTYGFGELSCEQRSTLIRQQTYEVVSKVDATCETVGDCVLVEPTTSCSSACPWVISQIGKTELAPRLTTIGEVACELGVGCASDSPSCEPIDGVQCVNGRCVR